MAENGGKFPSNSKSTAEVVAIAKKLTERQKDLKEKQGKKDTITFDLKLEEEVVANVARFSAF